MWWAAAIVSGLRFGSPRLSRTNGDSGAVVWAYDSTVNPVGLLVGGHPLTQISFATPISWVLDYLDLNLL
jgi:hypothetical protein